MKPDYDLESLRAGLAQIEEGISVLKEQLRIEKEREKEYRQLIKEAENGNSDVR